MRGLTVQATAAVKLVLTTQPPTNVTAGVDFPVVARVLDRFNNLATGFNGGVQASFFRNPGPSTLGGTTRVSAVNGVVTMTGLSLNKAANGYQLQLTGAGLPTIVTGGVNVRPAAATTTSRDDSAPVERRRRGDIQNRRHGPRCLRQHGNGLYGK